MKIVWGRGPVHGTDACVCDTLSYDTDIVFGTDVLRCMIQISAGVWHRCTQVVLQRCGPVDTLADILSGVWCRDLGVWYGCTQVCSIDRCGTDTQVCGIDALRFVAQILRCGIDAQVWYRYSQVYGTGALRCVAQWTQVCGSETLRCVAPALLVGGKGLSSGGTLRSGQFGRWWSLGD